MENATYHKALQHTQYQCRDRGIDVALQYNRTGSDGSEFDALLLCDHKGAGQQLAAQAGKLVFPPFDPQQSR